MGVPRDTGSVQVHKLHSAFSPIGFQILTFSIFALGAVLGVIGDHGILFSPLRIELKERHFAAAMILMLTFVFMLVLTAFIKPVWRSRAMMGEASLTRVMASVAAMALGVGLLAFNLKRLSVFELITTNPAAIAFNITEQGGAVLFFSSMSVFYVGAVGLLDCLNSKFWKFLIAVLIVAFTFGVMLTTRRELVMILVAWGAFLLIQRIGAAKTGLLISPVMLAILVALLSFRNIDILESPFEYFASGEFEPMRFAVYLITRWTENVQFFSPVPYSLPFVSDTKVIEQVNATFASQLFNNTSALGIPTVTFFSSFLYLGLFVPLLFYGVHICIVRQLAELYRFSGSYLMSFAYVFSLVKLMLFIRNGEMFESLIDGILFLGFGIVYLVVAKVRFRRLSDS